MDRLRLLLLKSYIITDPHPAEAPGAKSLRKMEGLPGTADLPDPETIRELVQDPESLEVIMVVLNPAPEAAPGMVG